MRHDIRIDGNGFRLRPAAIEDADFILALRTDPELGAFLHATSADRARQVRWMEEYFARDNDYYFVVESRLTGQSEGAIGVYKIDPRDRVGEWGRWILRRGSWASLESAWLIYRVAFEILDLDAVYCRTVIENTKVVSFHEECRLETVRALPRYLAVRGAEYDAIEHRLTRARWPELEARLARQAARLTAKLTAPGELVAGGASENSEARRSCVQRETR